jgi:hypothetical protein
MNAAIWVQAVATVVLVIVTFLYVRETRQMVRNMEREREEMRRPVLTFQLIAWIATALKLRIQNVGSGVAKNIEGTIESRVKSSGSARFSWSCPSLSAGQYEEFGVPMPEGTRKGDCFTLKVIQESIIDVRAKFKYKSTMGLEYELDDTIPIEKVTDDWVKSGMLVTEDRPERIMPRIAKALQDIAAHLGSKR